MKKEFLVVIEKGLDGYLIADVPELPGCHTQAKTKAELLERVKDAIQLYLAAEHGKNFVKKTATQIEKVVLNA